MSEPASDGRTPLRVLILEDRRDDVDLLLRFLARDGFDPQYVAVDERAGYVSALDADLDVILADYSLPKFSALEALDILRQRQLDVPFIVVTGTVGEESAVECIRRGAADYLLKDRLARLGAAIRHTLDERRLRIEKRRADASLAESEQRFRRLAENAQDIIYRYRTAAPEGFDYLSPAISALTGYGAEEFYADPALFRRNVHPDDHRALRDCLEGMPLSTLRFRRRDGTWLWLEMRAVALRDACGNVVAVEGIARDVSERVRSEEVLRASQQWLTAIFEASRDGIVVESNGRVAFANGAFARIFGYQSPQELVGLPVTQLQPPGEGPDIARLGVRRRAGENVPATYEFRGARKDGTFVDIEVSVSTTTIDGGDYIIAAIRDVSERKRLEEQFRQAQKMEAIGRLAGGVAHDFNNLLTAILGYTDLAVRRLPADSEAADHLEEVRKASESAAAVTRQLLAFSRKQVLQPTRLDLTAVLLDFRGMLARLVGEHIEMQFDLAAGLRTIKADVSQFEQVVMNLVVNARDAMPEGGPIVIATANTTVIPPGHADLVPTGTYVVLSVADSGTGLSPEVRRHLFEPFFTTKEPGKGTGLGLATVYGIVKQSGGWIVADSEPGQGSRFTVYFPALDVPADVRVRQSSAAPGDWPVDATILLVEDETSVRDVARRVLQRHGFRVIEAVDGDDALRQLEATNEVIDLVVTDVMMPHMSGRALARRIAELRPALRVLYMSGYTGQTLDEQWFDRSCPLLTKPFTPAVLLAAVHDAMHDGHGAGQESPTLPPEAPAST